MLNSYTAARAQGVRWARPHLETLCATIRRALESWAGEAQENAPDLAQAQASAVQLYRTLATLELNGDAVLANNISNAMNALGDRPDAEAAGVILEAIAMLPGNLERMETGAPDVAEIWQPIIERLQTVAGSAAETSEIIQPETEAFSDDELAQAQGVLAGRNRELFTAVAEAAHGELNEAKSSLNELLLGRAGDDANSGQIARPLKSVAESLSMLALDRLAERVSTQAEALAQIETEVEDPALQAIAHELLLVESELEESVLFLGEPPAEDLLEDEHSNLPKAEYRRVMRQLVHEALDNLNQAKHQLDQQHRGQDDDEGARQASQILNQTAHALHMSGLSDSAELLTASAGWIESHLIGVEYADVDREQLESLAEALIVTEFYLDSLNRLDQRGVDYLERARAQLMEMGYLDHIHEPETPEATDEIEQKTEKTAVSALDDDDFDLSEIFLKEFDEQVESLQSQYPGWRDRLENETLLADIRRAFHTLKGSGRMTGAVQIGEFCWTFEQLLNQTIEGQYQAEQVVELIGEAIDQLPELRSRFVEDPESELPQAAETLMAQAGQIRQPERMPELVGLDPALIQLMIKEIGEHLQTVESWVDSSRQQGWPQAVSSELILALHTIKGTLRLAPIGDEADSLQAVENYLQDLLDDEKAADEGAIELLGDVQTLLGHRLSRLQNQSVADIHFQTADLTGRANALAQALHRQRAPETSTEIKAVELPETEIEQATEDQVSETAQPVAAEADEAQDEPEVEPDPAVNAGPMPEQEQAPPAKREAPVLVDEATEDGNEAVTEPETDEEGDVEAERTVAAAADEAEASELLESEVASTKDETVELSDQNRPEDDTAEPVEAPEPEAAPEMESDIRITRVAEFEAWPESELGSLDTPAETEPQPDAGGSEEETQESAIQGLTIDYAELDQELLELFVEEGHERLESADAVLQQWREKPEDRSLVTALQRDVHTIKGSARMAGLNAVGKVAHVLEDVLEGIAGGQQQATRDSIDSLETGCDHLYAMVEAVEAREPMPAAGRIGALEIDQETLVETTVNNADLSPAANSAGRRVSTIRMDSARIEELLNFAGEVSIFRSRIEQEIGGFRNHVNEIEETVLRLRDQLRKLEQETETQILSRHERERDLDDSAFDPLEMDRYSTIQQLSRALAESVSDLNSLTELMDNSSRQSETLLMQQARVNTELQEGLMQARMVSFSTIAPRLRRVVRNTARDVDKQVELHIHLGGEGELDRNVLDRMTAPIEHILRNAITHGLETPAQRRKAKKSETGLISIDVEREATEMIIRVSDDGQGLDLKRIRDRALKQKLLTKKQAHDDAAVSRIIFHPGFSTVDKVSELAGRGVGMEVVANETRQIGGRINVHSEPGRGARFEMRIPLSLAVMQAILVQAGERPFAIPLQAVRGVARLRPREWQEALAGDGTYQYGGEHYPLMELEPQLGLPPAAIEADNLSLLMIATGNQRAAIRVSEIQAHREIVLKPVGPQVSAIPGVLAGTIMGDGQVVVILDIAPLIDRALEQHLVPGKMDITAEEPVEKEVKRTPLVMVVDDSITMRRVTSRILEHHGLEVITARDGVEAVDQLYERIPDLMLLDIEMPRMDGFEVAAHVRDDSRLSDLPIMMITSRSGDKHREHAKSLGVERYMIKPYQEASLVREVFEILHLPQPESGD